MVGMLNRKLSSLIKTISTLIKASSRSKSSGAGYQRSKSHERHTANESDRVAQQFMRETATIRGIKAGNYLRIDEKDLDDVLKTWQSEGGAHVISELNYKNIGFGAEARLLVKLLKANTVSNIRTLCLAKNSMQNESIKVILKALRSNTTVISLDLSANHIGDKVTKYIAKMLAENNVLQHLDLSNNIITSVGGKNIAKALESNTSLRHLFIQSNNLMAKGAIAFSKILEHNKTIQHIDLGCNRLIYEGINALSKAIRHNRGLEYLAVDLNEMGLEGTLMFAEALRVNKVLTHVYMPRNNIGDKGVVWLSVALRNNSTVRYLDLEDNSIGLRGSTEGAEALAELLRINTTLRVLNLTTNSIRDEGSLVIADALRVNTTLERLILTDCSITLDGIDSLSTCLKSNKSLQYLALDRNAHFDVEGHWLLANALHENHALKGLQLDYNVDDWQRLYDSIQTSLTRNYMLQRTKYASACRILTTARILLHGRPLSYGRPSWESTRTERVCASVKLRMSRNLADLPFEVYEAIFLAIDVEQRLTLAEVRNIAYFATNKETLKKEVTKGVFLKNTFGNYFVTHEPWLRNTRNLRYF
ncbi:hypothetical protein BC937DRAFT_89224 [Endogone sp. FLAS-F59071]|nr:hypothetical protein BC937DRAFT_89224 [Endogone sp. FLAS-F59071]|eukprot:RUS22433.1 hypothetical protein BC937DRAFT_89224 [Endogone sp. FLAS-F59071]